MNAISRYRLLGCEIDGLTQSDLNALVREAVESGRSTIVANHNLHSVHSFLKDRKMQAFYTKADYTVVDGMSLIILGRLLGLPLKRAHRLAMLDILGPIFAEAAQKGWRIFHLGNTVAVCRQGAARLQAHYPGLQVQTEHGYFDVTPGSDDNRKVLEKIHGFRPNILLVGMGMPRQESWIVDHLDQLSGMVILNVGAYLGYVAGDIPTAPRWLGRIGLEWLFRLCTEPARLGRRYLIEPWIVLSLLLQQGNRKLPTPEDKTS